MAFMDGAEPVTLYISPDSGSSAFSWRPDAALASHFLAMPESGRAETIRTSLANNSADVKDLLRSQFERNGGLWTSVERVGERARVLTRYWQSPHYAPPSRILLLNAGEPMELRNLSGSETTLDLGPAQCALVPVDLRSEEQLQRWLEGLQGLPADLQTVTLQRALNGAIIGAGEHAHHPARSRSIWLPIAAAAAGALLGGAAGFVAGTRIPPAPLHAPAELVDRLHRLGAFVQNSDDPEIKFLSDFHREPVALEPPDSAAALTAETWIALKLALYRQRPEAARESNEAALKQYREIAQKLPPSRRQAVLAAACSVPGKPVGGIADAAQCKQVDTKQALAGLDELATPAEGAKKK